MSTSSKSIIVDVDGIVDCKSYAPMYFYFNKYRYRLKTFEDWPASIKVKPESLSRAGFFYSGFGDKCICFYCGVCVKDWFEMQNPWARHATATCDGSALRGFYSTSTCIENICKPNYSICKFLILSKGKNYINKHMANQKRLDGKICGGEEESCSMTTDFESATEPSCKVCYDRGQEVCVFPCAHVAVCVDCSLEVNKCPVCRVDIEKFVRVYIC